MNKTNTFPIKSLHLVGVILAAGTASLLGLGQLPYREELFPIGYHTMRNGDTNQPKALSPYLLDRMQLSGVKKTFFILRNQINRIQP